MVRPSKMMHNYATKQPFVRRAAAVIFGLFAAIRRELLEGPLRRSIRRRRATIRRVPHSSSLHLPAVVPELSELPYAPQFQLNPEKD